MKPARRHADVNLDELDRVLDGARQEPLSEADYDKLKAALHALAAMLVQPRHTEKTSAVLEEEGSETSAGTQPDTNAPPPPGHGRNPAEAFGGGRKVDIAHQKLKHGDRCPECGKGNVYGQKEPKVLVRIVGQAPLAATVYSLERLRCGACGQVFTAQEPEGVGPEKYDETAAAMIAQLKYGSGIPFYRLEQLEKSARDSVTGGDTVGDGRRGGRDDQTSTRRVDPAGGAGGSDAQRRYPHAGAAARARAGGRAHGCVHQLASFPPGRAGKSHFSSREANMRERTWPAC
jgi:hypothetical protein